MENIAKVLQYIENHEHIANPNLRGEEWLQNDLQDGLQDNNNSLQQVRQKSNPTKSVRRAETHASYTNHLRDLQYVLEAKQDLRHKLNSKRQYKKQESEGSSASTGRQVLK